MDSQPSLSPRDFLPRSVSPEAGLWRLGHPDYRTVVREEAGYGSTCPVAVWGEFSGEGKAQAVTMAARGLAAFVECYVELENCLSAIACYPNAAAAV